MKSILLWVVLFSHSAHGNTVLSATEIIIINLPSGDQVLGVLKRNGTISRVLSKVNNGLGSFDVYNIDQSEVIGHLATLGGNAIGQIVSNHQVFKIQKSLKSVNTFSASLKSSRAPLIDTHGCNISVQENRYYPRKSKSQIERIETTGDIRTFRLAVVTTGGYYIDNGANDDLVLLSIVDAVNRLNDIYKKEIGVVFELLPPYIQNLTPETDEFTTSIDDPNADPDSKNEQAADAVARHFESEDYDIGHVFSSLSDGAGFDLVGLANIGAVCRNFVISDVNSGLVKAGGWSGVTIDFIQTLAHEVGHMLGAQHTFNGSGRFCDNAIANDNAYEIGSGTTIMSYFTLCSEDQNVIGRLGLYFHARSIIQMLEYIDQFGCGNIEATTNVPPVFESDQCIGATIPTNTPFLLSGSTYDDDGDPITSNWEQYDEDGSGTPTQGFIGGTAANSAIAPLFISEMPNANYHRSFPSNRILLDSVNSDFEVLPMVAREMNFRFTTRDNLGGTATDQIKIDVDPSGPMIVTNPSEDMSFEAGQEIAVKWNPNGSESLCELVDIELSLDGGYTFGIPLATAINYGDISHNVILPNNISNTDLAKIRVICSDSECVRFFNLSAGNFNINSSCSSANTWFFPDEPVSVTSVETDQLNFNFNFNFTEFQILEGDLSIFFDGNEPTAPPFGRESADCQQANFEDNYSIVHFTVTITGDYSFWLDDFITVAIFAGKSPDLSNPCTSVIEVNRTFTNIFNVTNGFLTAGQVYSLVIYGQQGDGVTISPVGPGQLLTTDFSSSTYTYVAIDESGILVRESQSGDFSNLMSGNYFIYGVNVPEQIDFESHLGQSLIDLLSDACLRFSSNSKDIRIRQSCSGVREITETICSFQEVAGYNQTGRYTDVFPMGESCDSTRILNLTVLPTQRFMLDTVVCGNVSLFEHSETGIYLDTVVQNNQCLIVDLTLEVLEAPIIELVADFESSDVCNGDPLLIRVSDADQSLSYNWSNNTIGSAIEVIMNGTYAVTVTNTFNCSKSDSVIVELERNLVVTSQMTICEGESIVGHTISGTYEDRYSRSNLCDSVHILELEVIPTIRTTVTQSICAGEQFLGFAMSGSYEDVFPSALGCDSIRILELIVEDAILGSSIETICSGDNFQGRAVAGQYVDINIAANGCDSTHELTLIVIPVDTAMLSIAICVGQEFMGRNTSGIFEEMLTNSQGCDSLLIVDLLVLSTVTQSVFEQICAGEEFAGYAESGVYEDRFVGSSGCDSIRRLNLVVLESQTVRINETICSDESYEVYNESATYVDVLTSSFGCDSIRILDLVVLPQSMSDEIQSICPGENYQGRTVTGIYTDTLTTAFGCDSIHILNLKILTPTESMIAASICIGEEIFGYNNTGVFTDVFVGKNGCDSTRTIDLMVIDEVTSTVTMTICEDEEIDGYNKSGQYLDILQSVGGCDSVRTLILTVNPSVSAIIEASICSSESVAGYSEAGMYIDVYASATGCDSTRTLLLDINETAETEIFESICSGQSVAGYTTAGVYNDSFVGSNGCDSIRILDLTVLALSESQISRSICSGEQFEIYDASGIYIDTFTSVNGCDSIRRLDLTVFSADDENCRPVDIEDYNDRVYIFPNPTTSTISIDLPKQAQLLSLNIFDAAGRRVFSSAESSTIPAMITVINLSAGIYILEGFVIDNGTNIYFYKKFLKI